MRLDDITKDNGTQAFQNPDEILNQPIYVSADELRAYDKIVRPDAIVPVTRYFLDNWLPLLGVSRAWLALAFRQVAFVNRASSQEVSTRTTLRRLGAWCGLTHVRIHQLLQQPALLNWFVRNPQGSLSKHSTRRSEPSTFFVRCDIPLTPADQQRLLIWFNNHQVSADDEWLELIYNALEAQHLDLPTDADLPQQSLTIQQIVNTYRGSSSPLPPSLDRACNELHTRWTLPDRAALISHYFLRQWLPDLSAGLGWLIVLLRSRSCFQHQETSTGNVWLKGGVTDLASSLNVSSKSVSRWLNSAQAAHFLESLPSVQDPADKRCRLYSIQLSEPIHPNHKAEYEALLYGQNLTSTHAVTGQNLTRPFVDEGQNLTSPVRETVNNGQNLTREGQFLTKVGQNLTSKQTEFNKNRTKFNNLSTLKSTLKNPLIDSQQQPVVLWPIKQIAQDAGISVEHINQQIKVASDGQFHFIAWLLFGIATRTIEFPALFALKRMQKDLPPVDFLQLAKISPVTLLGWLQNPLYEPEAVFQNCLSKLRKADSAKYLLRWGIGNSDQNLQFEKINTEGNLPAVDQQLACKTWGSTTAESEACWLQARSLLEQRLERSLFETWVRDLDFVRMDGNITILATANPFARDWLQANLAHQLEEVLSEILGRKASIRLVVL